MTHVTSAEAKKSLSQLLDQVSQSHEPVHISGKSHNAVLVSEEDWRSINETLHLLSIKGMRESIIEGLKTPVSECSKDLEW